MDKQTVRIGSMEDIDKMEFVPIGNYLTAQTGTVERSWTDHVSPAIKAEIVPDKHGDGWFFRYIINRYDSDWISSWGTYATAEEAIKDCRESIKDDLEAIMKG